jgi:hypothetical protein
MKQRYIRPSNNCQRVLYLALAGLAGVAVLQQFLFPLTPSLPRLPEVLPPALAARKLQPVSPDHHQQPILWERQYAVGQSQQFQASDGSFLILTPLSSWMGRSLDPIKAAASLSPPLSLSTRKILTIRPNQVQIAIGHLTLSQRSPSPAYQGCLSRYGQVSIDGQHLATPRPGFWQKALHTLWPSTNYSAFCVLITTNQRNLLDGSPASDAFIKGLLERIVWPR